ncbi:MarR family transcriptional regulator [Phycicoccus sp. M110.8]|uniref:MarR family winged helix-turn-helix transcriptional regulator n=1 Tax=Phycicoccus sp. M110.8 TaxID=3075433 RepID=UPI0028FD6E7E|nr:MarR family transcriptional regulator [Phycicoccus sp. M110.8]MDU0315521.1 MarR family transcriptional regulator [Phycicoccus sp. M110.8]
MGQQQSGEGTATDRVAHIQEQWRRERPDLDTSPVGVIGRLHRLAAHLTGELVPVYRRFGLGEGDFDVLASLRRAGQPYELAPGDLARHTMVTTGGMTKRLDRLEEAGLVTRRAATGDRRGRVVALTERGRALVDDAIAAHLANERRILEALSPADRDDLERILTAWLARYEG